MSKEILRIETVEPKVSKAKKSYVQVNGKYTVFEKDLMRQLEDNVGSTFEVEIVTNGNFSNIREIYGEVPANTAQTAQVAYQAPAPAVRLCKYCGQPETMHAANCSIMTGSYTEPIETVRPGEVAKKVITEEAKAEEVKIVKDKPNSRTFGQGKDQIKLYFDDANDLEKQIIELEVLNLMPADWKKLPSEEEEQ